MPMGINRSRLVNLSRLDNDIQQRESTHGDFT